MKCLRIVFLGVFYLWSENSEASTCIFDKKYKNTSEYINYNIEEEINNVSKKDNMLELLPDIYISSGQSASNNNSFKSPEFNSAGISISQTVYAGGFFFKNIERAKNNEQSINIKRKEARIKFILDAFSAIQKLKNTNALIETYNKHLEHYRTESMRDNYLYKQGDLSELELKLKNNNIKKYEKISENLKHDATNIEWELKSKFFILPHEAQKIDLNEVKKCKTDSFFSIAKQTNFIENKVALNNYEMEKSSYYPSLSLSLNLTPKHGGTLRDISIKEGAYGISMNLNIPVSGILKLSSLEERHKITISQINANKDKRNSELNAKRKELEYKLKIEENNLKEYINELNASNLKLNYLNSSSHDNKTNIVNYINESNNIYSLENKISNAKNEIEIYKAYIFYID